MPRPGPRPYECVRRAWHSDRHQPIRGSIIQQIFRVVHERHSVKTKKKREWQEKLPPVVLKAEEIMYSKANSEVEYMDLDTLWGRVNEAIDMIIRRYESTETEEFLPPCVEAALNLGCIPTRASRSQRHSNPRSYLNPRIEEPRYGPKVLGNAINNQNASLIQLGIQSISERMTPVNYMHLASELNSRAVPSMCNHPSSSCVKMNSPANATNLPMDSSMALNVCSVYPLYYGTDFQPEVQQLSFMELQKSNEIIEGRPVFQSLVEPAKVGCLPSLSPCGEDRDVPNRMLHQGLRDKCLAAPETECDLSLRLGLTSDSSMSTASVSAGSIGTGPRSYLQGGEFSVVPFHKYKEFSFFPVESGNDPSGQHSRWRSSEGEGQFAEDVLRKRKMPAVNMHNRQFSWQQEPTSNHFAGKMKRPGL